MIPEGVRHFYLRLGAGVKLRRASPLRAARPVSIKRLTLKQKRARKAEAADDAAVAIGTHSLLLALDAALAELKPASALVFICRSAGLTVRRATRELRALGLPATALHEAIGLEHDAEGEGGGGGGEGGAPRRTLRRAGAGVAVRDDPSERLQQRHARVAAAFAAQLSVGEGGGEGADGGGGAAGGGAAAAGAGAGAASIPSWSSSVCTCSAIEPPASIPIASFAAATAFASGRPSSSASSVEMSATFSAIVGGFGAAGAAAATSAGASAAFAAFCAFFLSGAGATGAMPSGASTSSAASSAAFCAFLSFLRITVGTAGAIPSSGRLPSHASSASSAAPAAFAILPVAFFFFGLPIITGIAPRCGAATAGRGATGPKRRSPWAHATSASPSRTARNLMAALRVELGRDLPPCSLAEIARAAAASRVVKGGGY